MVGLTLTLMKVDAELKELVDYKTNTVALKQF
jgi:dihydroxyacetone kinase